MRLSTSKILSISDFPERGTYQFPKVRLTFPVCRFLCHFQSRVIRTDQSSQNTRDQSYENNNNDQLKTKVEKDGEIVVALTSNRLLFSPTALKIWAEKASGTLGLYSCQEANSEW